MTSLLTRFRNESPARQLLAALGVTVIVAAVLAAIWWFGVRESFRPAFRELDAGEAAALVAELDRLKMPYRLADSGATIEVPSHEVDRIRVSLAANLGAASKTVGFELFNESDMGMTDLQQRVNLQRATEGELARTIMTLDGVDSARVHLSMAEDGVFRVDRAPPRAAVVIRMRDGRALRPEVVRGVARLVAAAAPRLAEEAVTVVDDKGRIASPGVASLAPLLPAAEEEDRAVEQLLGARVRAALEAVLPGASFRVGVTLQRNTDERFPASSAGDEPAARPRLFAIRAQLLPARLLSDEEMVRARAIAAEALGLDSSLGDVLTIVQPWGRMAPAAPAAIDRDSAGDRATGPDGGKAADDTAIPGVIEVGAGIILLILLAALLGARRSTARALAPGMFAEQLRRALAEDERRTAI